jgi:hypothetical protein
MVDRLAIVGLHRRAAIEVLVFDGRLELGLRPDRAVRERRAASGDG